MLEIALSPSGTIQDNGACSGQVSQLLLKA